MVRRSFPILFCFLCFFAFFFCFLHLSSLFWYSVRGQGKRLQFPAQNGEFHSDPVCTDPRAKLPDYGLPKGPSRTKNTTERKFTIRSKFTTAKVKHYGGHFETTSFKGKVSSRSLQIVKKTTAVVKHYGIECRSAFSMEGSFGQLSGLSGTRAIPSPIAL